MADLAMVREATLNRVMDFVAEQAATKRERLEPNSQLGEDLGLDGDDFSEFMERFSGTFGVDLSDYRWYHHHGTEGLNPFHLLIRPWWAKAQQIPVTVAVLAKAAEFGRWPVEYQQAPLSPTFDWGNAAFLFVFAGLAGWGLYAWLEY